MTGPADGGRFGPSRVRGVPGCGRHGPGARVRTTTPSSRSSSAGRGPTPATLAPPGFGWTGPGSDLRTAVTAAAVSSRRTCVPAPDQQAVRRDEARGVDGHLAPALLVVPVLDTHAELHGTIDRVLDDVVVL
ncbi:hypothetical protein SAMN05660464_1558 [Geodermatophilus dictyosporus]|uniref:Uncharacterized protein n=1 Tax=Geodermatophilus dictyosporus TaxID=1523247 RepID=A0A1I5L5B8_9ACTN|nr:hypothetical protein [Geodermatophilus dictyosporus]SFO92398.1 hypothetical protein SAMN05660464_1558 [Geodermatophilus dictyosporus]